MTEIKFIIQSKDDPTNLLSTEEKLKSFPEGVTVVFIEAATKGGQLGIQFIIKGQDHNGNMTINTTAITENMMEAMMGGFIGVRMRFGRMPADQFEMVRHYVKDKAKRFLDTLDHTKRKLIETDVKKFFGI